MADDVQDLPLREGVSAPGCVLSLVGWVIRAASKALASERAMLAQARACDNVEHLMQQLQTGEISLPCVVAIQAATAATDRPASADNLDTPIVMAHKTLGVECVDSASNGFYTTVVCC